MLILSIYGSSPAMQRRTKNICAPRRKAFFWISIPSSQAGPYLRPQRAREASPAFVSGDGGEEESDGRTRRDSDSRSGGSADH